MIVGFRPAKVKIQPNMPVTVDFPLVPATAMPAPLLLNKIEFSSALDNRRHPSSFAFLTSGTVSSTAADVTKI